MDIRHTVTGSDIAVCRLVPVLAHFLSAAPSPQIRGLGQLAQCLAPLDETQAEEESAILRGGTLETSQDFTWTTSILFLAFPGLASSSLSSNHLVQKS